MVTPSEGALGGIDFSEEQRRELAEKSRANEVNFTFGSEKRREVTRLIHEKMLGRMGKAKQAAKKILRSVKVVISGDCIRRIFFCDGFDI